MVQVFCFCASEWVKVWFRFRSDLVQVWFRFGAGLVQVVLSVFRMGSGLEWVQVWFRFGSGLVQIWFRFVFWFRFGAGSVQVWFTFGSGLVQVWLLGFRLVSDSAFRVQGGFRLGFRFFVYSMLVSLLQFYFISYK